MISRRSSLRYELYLAAFLVSLCELYLAATFRSLGELYLAAPTFFGEFFLEGDLYFSARVFSLLINAICITPLARTLHHPLTLILALLTVVLDMGRIAEISSRFERRWSEAIKHWHTLYKHLSDPHGFTAAPVLCDCHSHFVSVLALEAVLLSITPLTHRSRMQGQPAWTPSANLQRRHRPPLSSHPYAQHHCPYR